MLNAPVHKEAPNRLIGNDQASAIWTIRLVGLAQSVASIAGRRSLYPSRGNCDVRGMSTSLPLILRKRRLSRHSGTHTLCQQQPFHGSPRTVMRMLLEAART